MAILRTIVLQSVLSLGVLLATAPMTYADEAANETAPEKSDRHGPIDRAELETFVDGIMAVQLKDKHIAGATIAFVVDNRPFFAKGYGYADVVAKKPVNADETMFRIGSVSKLFTWTAVMRLAEQGKLDLDADVNDYLTEFKIPATYPEPITLRHILAHTPGFEDQVIGLFAHSVENMRPLGKVLAEQLPMRVRKPGELSSYSNHGTAIAGYIVQQVTGVPWEQYIEETILQPLGMKHTTVRQPAEDKLPAEMSKGYKYERGKFMEEGFEYVPPAPAGSMSASAGDMVKFMIAHLQNGEYGTARILSEDSATQMRRLLFTHDPRIEGMAYGFMRMNYGGELIVEHGGDTKLFHSYFVMLPERQSGFFVSYNTTTAGNSRDILLQALMDRYYAPHDPPPPKPTSDFNERANLYLGQYGAIRHSYSTVAKLGALFSVVKVSTDDGQLVVSGGGGSRRFVEVEPLLFREVDGQRTVAFRKGDNDQMTHLFFGGSPVAFEKLSWHETPGFTAGLVIACASVFLSALIGWPLAAFINRGSQRQGPSSGGSALASWIGWFMSLAILVAGGLAMIPFRDPDAIVFGVPTFMSALLWSTPALAGLVAIMLACTLVAWRKSYWRLSGRLHYTSVLLAGVAFVWFMNHWNLLGFGA